MLLSGCEPTAEAEGAAPRQTQANPQTQPTGFDFYVLALSWSPSFCRTEGADANPQQCAAARPHSFIVHGLWPQFERGYPENCSTERLNVSPQARQALYDLMPSDALILHQWRKHGSCSGLDQDAYFATLRKARERIAVPEPYRQLESARRVVPDDVERAFVDRNPGLPADGIAITCDGRLLREVRICLTKALSFRSCPEVDRRACRARSVTMPPVRG